MGTTSKIISRKFYSQLYNGATFASNLTDFTTNLVGSAGEKIQSIQVVEVDWWSGAINGDTFTFVRSGYVQRLNGSFLDDGFTTGDTFNYTPDLAGGASVFNGTITAVTDTDIFYTVGGGAEPAVGTIATDKYFRGTTVLKSLLYNYNFIENQEAVNFNSKLDGKELGYTFQDLTVSTTGLVLNGINSNETGSITCSAGTVVSTYYQQFTITHTFRIPYYAPTFEDNYLDETLPSDYDGSNSLKYVCRCEFRVVYSNPNGSKIFVDQNNLGSVAFFNENFNGLQSLYTFDSVVYTDADANVIAGIQKTGITHVVAVITGTAISADTNFGILVSRANEYAPSNLSATYSTNYIVDSVVGTIDDASASSTIITNYTCTLGVDSATYEFDVEYSTPQKALITTGDKFLIGLQIGNGLLDNQTSDKTTFLEGSLFGDYIVDNDVQGLLVWRDNRYYSHLQVYPDTTDYLTQSEHDFKGWLEDGILNNFNFDLDLSLGAKLDSLKVEFVAYNNTTREYFVIGSYNYNTKAGIYAPVNGGSYSAWQYDILWRRDFNLPEGDQFNMIKLATATDVKNTSWLNYNAVVTWKIDWQKWIPNNNADTSFVNLAELYNGLNQHSPQYISGDWQLKFLYTAGVTCDASSDATLYEFLSPRIIIKDYDVDGNTPPKWSAAVSTYTEDGVTDLDGKILYNANTLFKIVWTFDSADYGVMTDVYSEFIGIHRIENHYIPSSNNIEELSSLRFNLNQKLKPVAGSTLLKVTTGVSTITTECIIDYKQLQKGTNNKLSGRLFATNALLGLTWEEINVQWEFIDTAWQYL